MKVFYDQRQSVAENKSSSPSAKKPALFVEALLTSGLPMEIQSFHPLSTDEIKLAHDPFFVDQILTCKLPNGFDNCSPEIAESLPWTNGSFVAAAIYAFKHKEIVCSPTSGFHHAHYNMASDYCTFNGLIIAALRLYQLGAKKIGIVDCDQHFGNGTKQILSHLNINYVNHYSYGYDTTEPSEVANWLRLFKQKLKSFSDCDVVLYQAGADPFLEDPLGGAFSVAELFKRDRILFDWSRSQQIPVAWNLAGGYANPFSKVLEIHLNTAKAAVEPGAPAGAASIKPN